MATFVPDRGEFLESIRKAQLTFVYREVLMDGLTPVLTFARLGRGPYSFLLESVVGREKWASHSFIGVRPRRVFRARGHKVEILRSVGEHVAAGAHRRIDHARQSGFLSPAVLG
jgi:anthranilate synthase component 1